MVEAVAKFSVNRFLTIDDNRKDEEL